MPGIEKVQLYTFKTIKLEHMIVFEHLAGTALSKWLNNSSLKVTLADGTERQIDNLRYVHGRSEVMKGKQTISSVVLADPTFTSEISLSQWIAYLPTIYSQYLVVPKET